MRLKDKDVRQCLYSELYHYFEDDSSTCVIDELQVCNGLVRVDVAAINGELYGYEIKSESDTLERLPTQALEYSKVFDRMYLVCSDRFLDDIYDIIPDWWGVYSVYNVYGRAEISLVKKSEINRNHDIFSLLQFLRKDELVEFGVERDYGSRSHLNKTPKFRLWQQFADIAEIDMVLEFVKITLKSRRDWRIDLLRK